ncbi:MAG TPA: transposase [Streptosporangiaceae bacterium]|nr:transposase [Streptosporangiaceae bacterium]
MAQGTREVRRAYKFRVYLTAGQAGRAALCLRDHQRMYNAALEERREAWRRCRASISYGSQSAQLRDIRALDPDQGRWSFSSQQATLRRLSKAMAAFYRRCKAGQKPGYPRFRAVDRWDSVEWPSDGDGCKWKPEAARVYLQGIGHVKVHAHRSVRGRVKTITLKREGRRWYVIMSCDDVPANPLPATGREVGLDVGVARFATTSDGEVIVSPRFARASAAEMTEAQQALARKKRGSANRRRAKAKVGEVHRRTRNRRADFHHKVARALIRACDAIGLEDLKIRNMTRSASGTLEKPGTNVAAKSGLNRSVLDAGWGQFMSILAGKAEEAGRRIVLVNPRNTSITCHHCGVMCTRPRQDTVICPAHGAMDADVNAARNIYARAGLGSGQAHAA